LGNKKDLVALESYIHHFKTFYYNEDTISHPQYPKKQLGKHRC